NDAVQVFMDGIRNVKKNGFTEKDLRDQKEVFLTSYYLGQETIEAQAMALGAAELKNGWEYAENFKDMIYSLSLEEINAAFRKYATNIAWYYLGDENLVDEAVFTGKLD
ncbi:MAG: hypothetical protein M3Q97_06450, partial [Bacteroidota bacterium]|nr:hypothetical protein [Bacteroidota bacterium]